MKKTLTTLLVAIVICSFKGEKETYKVFNDIGKKSSYSKILAKVEKADIVLFGEMHNNPINHWLELELVKDLFKITEDIALGAEMYESDNQLLVNEYLGGHYDYNTFKKDAKLWPNDETDYLPLLDFAMSNQLTFVATNVPRRYANMVYKEGFKVFNHLRPDAKKFIAPIPFKFDPKLPSYVKINKMAKGHGGENLAKAQATKDATMSHFILKNWVKGRTFFHINGTYHSNNFEGIYWYLKQANPDLRILTINCIEQAQIDELDKEHHGTAHIIIVTPESMTKTH